MTDSKRQILEKILGWLGLILLCVGLKTHVELYTGIGLGILTTGTLYRIWQKENSSCQ